jgi:hypothetical protein
VWDPEKGRVRALVNRNQRYRARTTKDVVHRMGQPVHGDTDKQVRIDKAPVAERNSFFAPGNVGRVTFCQKAGHDSRRPPMRGRLAPDVCKQLRSSR